MSGRLTHLRRIAATAAAVVGISVLPAARADAAYFTSTPPTYNGDGAGPFYYSFQSNQSGQYGYVAYKLSTESYWHRCLRTGQVSLSDLPDGQYSITISDDYNSEWYAEHNTWGAGSPCYDESPFAKRTHTFYVDTVAPSLGAPSVTTRGKYAEITVSASDTTGISRLEWSTGDGGFETTPGYQRMIWHTYPSYGSYGGTVWVTDMAGNTASTPFRVDLKAPATPPPSPPPPTSPPSVESDDPAPSLSASNAELSATAALRKKFGRSYKRGLHRKIACGSRITRLRRSCKASWRYKTWRYRGTVTVWRTNYDWRDGSYHSLHIVRIGSPCNGKSCRRVYER